MLFILWIAAAFICAIPAQKKPIGYGMCVFLGVILSPIVGLIIALASKDFPPEAPPINYNDELLKLVTLKEKGAITEDEYSIQKLELDNKKGGKVIIKDIQSLNEAKKKGQITQEEYLIEVKKF